MKKQRKAKAVMIILLVVFVLIAAGCSYAALQKNIIIGSFAKIRIDGAFRVCSEGELTEQTVQVSIAGKKYPMSAQFDGEISIDGYEIKATQTEQEQFQILSNVVRMEDGLMCIQYGLSGYAFGDNDVKPLFGTRWYYVYLNSKYPGLAYIVIKDDDADSYVELTNAGSMDEVRALRGIAN
jgi:hypothetical protein